MNPIAQTVISKDGTPIGFQSSGNGPGLLVIPGSLSTSKDFTQLAAALSDAFTVHVVDRRGRGESGPQGAGYSIEKECEDLQAVQRMTAAEHLFGHSYGGLVALEASRGHARFHRMALFEPGVIARRAPEADWAWVPAYEAAMAREDWLGAFASFVKGAGHSKAMARLPDWLVKLLLKAGMPKDQWAQIETLLPANLNEHREFRRLEATIDNYRGIEAEVLLMSGGKSPASVHEAIDALDRTLPKTRAVRFPELHHLAPDNRYEPLEVAAQVKQFLLS